MKERLLLSLFLLINYCVVLSQEKNQWVAPLQIPLKLSGNFGEFRNNHFHSGFDLKTNGIEGLPVYAVADGYVSRIKISAWGYGYALYLQHPNGQTTVYGHLRNFSPIIDSFIRTKQYAQKSFEIEYFPKVSELKVQKGELIAFSGNTGGSGGPHLHFEVRDTQSEDILNPYFFFNLIRDQKPPSIQGLWLYTNSDTDWVQNSKQIALKLPKNSGIVQITEPIKVYGNVFFACKAFDTQGEELNQNGIYKISLVSSKDTFFNLTFNRFAFSETRYVNALIDYKHLLNHGETRMLLTKKPGNKLMALNKSGTGILQIKPFDTLDVKIILADFLNNTTQISVRLIGTTRPQNDLLADSNHHSWLAFHQENNFKTPHFHVQMPAFTLYQNTPIIFEEINGNENMLSNKFIWGNPNEPIHQFYNIGIKPTKNLASEFASKVIAISIDAKMRQIPHTGTFKNGVFNFKTRNFGTFYLTADTIKPTIKPLNITPNKTFKHGELLKVQISDNLSGVHKYQVLVNKEWELWAFDGKSGILSFIIPPQYKAGPYQIIIQLEDAVGNKSEQIIDININ